MPVQYVTFQVEVTARVDAVAEKCDYGVSGSPTWNEYTVNEVSDISIGGFTLDNMSEELRCYLDEMASEEAYNVGEWE